MKNLKTTSSLSKRLKILRNPFRRRNSRSTSFRFLLIVVPYSQGVTEFISGGRKGVIPKPKITCRVPPPPWPSSFTTQAPPQPHFPGVFEKLQPPGASPPSPGDRKKV